MVFFFALAAFGASMHARSCCSSAAHPCTLYPDDAQHPSIEVMIPTQGFDWAWFGLRTRNLGSGGNLVGASLVDPPLGAIV